MNDREAVRARIAEMVKQAHKRYRQQHNELVYEYAIMTDGGILSEERQRLLVKDALVLCGYPASFSRTRWSPSAWKYFSLFVEEKCKR